MVRKEQINGPTYWHNPALGATEEHMFPAHAVFYNDDEIELVKVRGIQDRYGYEIGYLPPSNPKDPIGQSIIFMDADHSTIAVSIHRVTLWDGAPHEVTLATHDELISGD